MCINKVIIGSSTVLQVYHNINYAKFNCVLFSYVYKSLGVDGGAVIK